MEEEGKMNYKDQCARINANYSIIAEYDMSHNKEILLGDKSETKKCRFCGKSTPDVSFKSDAHAIPHFIGNRVLKTLYECDSCNKQLFSKMEEQFDAYMRFYHVFCHVSRNGNTVNSYKCNSKSKAGVSVSDEWTDINCCVGEDLSTKVNLHDKTITISGVRSYNPLAVFKAVVKMALSIVPESDIDNFEDTLRWLMTSSIQLSHLNLSIRLYEGVHVFNGECMIYKRKDDHKENVPCYLFGLKYNSLFIQIYIPLCKEDKFIQGPISVPLMPCQMDAEDNRYLHFINDMSSNKKVSKENVSITFDYGNFTWDEKALNELKEQNNAPIPIVIKK